MSDISLTPVRVMPHRWRFGVFGANLPNANWGED